MDVESRRRLWPHRVTSWSHRASGADGRAGDAGPPARRGFDFDPAQAQALCDLVADPTSGITRVTVVSAEPRLLEAIEDVAAGRGVVLDEERPAAGAGGHATLEPPARPVRRGAARCTRPSGADGDGTPPQ
jgi:hypothetical protein